MNRIKLLFIGCFLIGFMSNASSQALKKGDMAVDVYYGWPNWEKMGLRGFGGFVNLIGENTYNPEYSGTGPLGARFDFMILDVLSVGLDVGFASATSTDLYYDYATEQTYTYTNTSSKISAVIMLGYHFSEMPENMDLAFNFGIGPAIRSFSTASNEPGYMSLKGSGPAFSFRLGTTYRFFFNDHFGLNAGLGFAHGGLINAGVSFKF